MKKNLCNSTHLVRRAMVVITLSLWLLPTMQAAPVDAARAERVARHFWNAHRDRSVAPLAQAMQRADLRWDGFYLFQPAECDGFVIVAADDAVRPVLAYSFHNRALRGDSVGSNMAWWLDGWQQQIAAARTAGLKATTAIADEWRLLDNDPVGDPDPIAAVEPMVTTQWDQDEPYNDSCPTMSVWGWTLHAATGCVATAMAQVMRYWEWPVRGTGTHTYYSAPMSEHSQGYGTQTVDFGATVYDWDNMPDRLTTVSPDAEIAAVATLMYHCGVASDMMYGSAYEGGSGTFIHNIPLLSYGHTLNGMINHFGYSSQARGVDRVKYDDSTWTAMVRGEIDAARPIIYAGGDENSGGHCFVCSGYDAQGRYHFNWGWSGAGDGYYTLDHLAPGTGGTGGGTGTYDFTNLQQILVGIQPHGDTDSLCIIRQYPYREDFESAPTCWSAVSSSQYSYSWLVVDSVGCDGNYSAYAGKPYYGSATERLVMPAIVDAGRYLLRWSDRPLGQGESFDLVLGDRTLCTVSSTPGPWEMHVGQWTMHDVVFDIAEGDTVNIEFVYQATPASQGLFIDNIELLRSDGTGIARHAAEAPVALYPNPTSGSVRVATQTGATVRVFDLTGRMVYTTVAAGTDVVLPQGLLPAGTYLVGVTTPAATATARLLVR